MDPEIIREYIPIFTQAFILTVKIGWIGIALAFLIGVLCAFTTYFKIPVAAAAVRCYVELFRNTPLLVQLFFIYYGLPAVGIRISAEVCGAIGLGLLGGSYMTESIRSGLEAIPVIQTESALSLGMTNGQLFRDVILPQAFTISVPGIVANVIFLLKETSVFSAISLMDLMFTAKDLIGLYYNTMESLFLLVIFYVIMLLPVSLAGTLIEKKVRYRMFGD
ncbi:MAG: amino acid ABC transporter permease [Lachnospiraceae bacterium]|nr:amino acid ABC transporter permease [Lachnospiraceae bacterium]